MKAFACGDVVPGGEVRWARFGDDDLDTPAGLVEVPPDLADAIRAAIPAVTD